MSFIIRKIRRRPNGQVINRDTAVVQAALTVGRDTECDIYLPDLRVGLNHAEIEVAQTSVRVIATGDKPVKAKGKFGKKFVFSHKEEGVVAIGPYELRIFREENDGPVIVSVEQVEENTDTLNIEDEEAIFSLKKTFLSKRGASFVNIALILGFFLAVPIYFFFQTTQPTLLGAKPDDAWLSGEISLVHANLASDCKSCHVKPFESVNDAVCLDCHEGIKDHAEAQDLRASAPDKSAGDAFLTSVGGVFGLEEGRCSSCHMEHNGHDGMVLTEQKLCTDCHEDLDTRLASTELLNAGDFLNDHPNFRPTIVETPARLEPIFTRVSLDDNPQDNSGLKFPHDIHLEADGGVARQAQELAADYGFGDKLECADCHTPDAGGALFNPVSMEANCAMCHSLVFERENGVDRTLRHGKPKDVIASMQDYYQAAALKSINDTSGLSDRRRPGDAARLREDNRRREALQFADERSALRVAEIFSEGGACYDCHTIIPPEEPGSTDYTVSPITLADSFMPKAVFNHDSHDTGNLTCESCHEAESSASSADVLMPDVASCRECHGGEKAVNMIPSTCIMCHGYHGGDHMPEMIPAELKSASVWPARETVLARQ